ETALIDHSPGRGTATTACMPAASRAVTNSNRWTGGTQSSADKFLGSSQTASAAPKLWQGLQTLPIGRARLPQVAQAKVPGQSFDIKNVRFGLPFQNRTVKPAA